MSVPCQRILVLLTLHRLISYLISYEHFNLRESHSPHHYIMGPRGANISSIRIVVMCRPPGQILSMVCGPKRAVYDWYDSTCSHVEALHPKCLPGRNWNFVPSLGNLGRNMWIHIAQTKNEQAMLVLFFCKLRERNVFCTGFLHRLLRISFLSLQKYNLFHFFSSLQ